MADFNFEIIEHIGKLSTNQSGWQKELTSVSWNDREARYDIRDWSPEYDKMGKGITFSNEELIKLRDLLNDMDL